MQLKADDIFKYFEEKATARDLPDLETLLSQAKLLYRAYGTARRRDSAAWDAVDSAIPRGTPWIPIPIEESSVTSKSKKKASKKATAKPKKAKEAKSRPPGDLVLAQSIDFFRDAINSRKISYCVAQGDVGRVYEAIKVCVRFWLLHLSNII